MSETAVYDTTVTWKGEHWGHIVMGNGPEMDFSAPPDAKGHAGVLTPEDAFVASVNTCIMMMFIWAAKRPPIGKAGSANSWIRPVFGSTPSAALKGSLGCCRSMGWTWCKMIANGVDADERG